MANISTTAWFSPLYSTQQFTTTASNFNEAYPINSPSQSLAAGQLLSEVPEGRSPGRLKRKGSTLESNRLVSGPTCGIGMASESLRARAIRPVKTWLKPAASGAKLRDNHQTSTGILPPHLSQLSAKRPPAQVVILKCQNFRKPSRASIKIGALYVPRFSLGCLMPYQPVFCVTGSIFAKLIVTALERDSALPLGTFAWDKDNNPCYLTSWTVSSLMDWLNNNSNHLPGLPGQALEGPGVATSSPYYPARANDSRNDISPCGNHTQSLDQAFTTATYTTLGPFSHPPLPAHQMVGPSIPGNWMGLAAPQRGNSVINSQEILQESLTQQNVEPRGTLFMELLHEELDFGYDGNHKAPIHLTGLGDSENYPEEFIMSMMHFDP